MPQKCSVRIRRAVMRTLSDPWRSWLTTCPSHCSDPCATRTANSAAVAVTWTRLWTLTTLYRPTLTKTWTRAPVSVTRVRREARRPRRLRLTLKAATAPNPPPRSTSRTADKWIFCGTTFSVCWQEVITKHEVFLTWQRLKRQIFMYLLEDKTPFVLNCDQMCFCQTQCQWDYIDRTVSGCWLQPNLML